MPLHPIAHRTARRWAPALLIACACLALIALAGPAVAEPGPRSQPGAATIGSPDWCRTYEHELLGLVSTLTDSVLLNLRLAMAQAGTAPQQVHRVFSLAKHPVLASYVEQKLGREVIGHYESMLDRVGCLKRP